MKSSILYFKGISVFVICFHYHMRQKLANIRRWSNSTAVQRQYLLTSQVNIYCLFALQSRVNQRRWANVSCLLGRDNMAEQN